MCRNARETGAAEYLGDAGEKGRADALWRLTRKLWRHLEDPEAARRVEGRIGTTAPGSEGDSD